MKLKYSLTLVLAASCSLILVAQETKPTATNAVATTRFGSHERFNAPVLQVFSATHSNAVFRAYLVSWKGHEVIVDDVLGKTAYEKGDVIPVLMMNLPHPDTKETNALLNFTIIPPEPGRDKRGRLLVP